jgi:MarR family transcriptional regulator, organic hydroperoxide resistance regulator
MGTVKDEIRQAKPFACKEDEVYVSIVRTAAALMRRETELLKAYDLTPPQYNVLRILRGAGQDGLICREISERMVTYDPDVTKLLDRLEARELVTRERQQQDRRVVVVRVSKQALKLLKKIDGPVTRQSKKLLGHLGLKRLDALNELLEAARKQTA